MRIAILGMLAGCGEVNEGGGAASCYSRTECAAGEYCTFAYADPPATGEPEPGSCLPKLAEGEPCLDGQCLDGFVCGSDPESVCVAIVDRGDPCDGATVCADGLVCHQGFDPPACQPPSVEGEACVVPEDCYAGVACDEGHCGGPPIVTDPPPGDTTDGGGCKPSEDEAHAGAASVALAALLLLPPRRPRRRP